MQIISMLMIMSNRRSAGQHCAIGMAAVPAYKGATIMVLASAASRRRA